ncbi:hypothetical protein M2192_005191 [Bradyrhizobium elkanii USDA 61]|uniref:Uncharacterized protein n=1 Tax=Bradyrhizobium elkanii TaxID=29448 RepID=A0A8I2BXT8_BRAEL|nr:hypothetical protein [Bradyrhizobium elkanii]MCS4008231.1 hypothetical protein [Bradyrhizobium elkanii USDA 61]MCP1928441.1 hypothetical protein [Bradyrhizobium elkanii]MCP1973068.1 hypothetical protein [Bradyrhizobium elkanii]MCS3580945.1 hypothetical protein [Bradyrhizobium elkanii]
MYKADEAMQNRQAEPAVRPFCRVDRATLLLDTGSALAQSATHGNPKTIGTPSAAQAQIVPSLIVLNSRGATLVALVSPGGGASLGDGPQETHPPEFSFARSSRVRTKASDLIAGAARTTIGNIVAQAISQDDSQLCKKLPSTRDGKPAIPAATKQVNPD